ncbi:MAG TPA: TIGR03619 family F420-dependent LLM class oxidoreductase [Acidothermaceae bacterium]|nr:TIGR03619 family F420-dependent LLM class oxidoreductase [Acidothermaceae bacterium]
MALPTYGPRCSAQGVLEHALAAEELGFDGVASTDHLYVPPGDPERFERVLEAITVLAALAPLTHRVRLMISMLVLPMRNPFLAAKQLATLDQLSRGRLVLGLSAGWNRLEFENLGADFSTRGARLDEAMALLQHLFSGSAEGFRGRYYSYENATFGPLPVGPGGVTMMVGGASDSALRRAARFADMWQSNPAVRADQYRSLVDKLNSLASGRHVEPGARINVPSGVGAMLQQATEYGDAGAEHVLLEFFPTDGFGARLHLFANEVLPVLKER